MKLKLLAFAAAASTAAAQSDGASAQCTAVSTTTVYYPVTTTVTQSCSLKVSPLVSDAGVSSGSAAQATISSTSTMTNTVTVLPATTSLAALSTSGGSSYYYGVNSGTTSWLNGVSPSSGASLTTGTTTMYVSPVATMPSDEATTTVHVRSTATELQTLTIPAYTSTKFSIMSPSSVSTITSTSTSYHTVSIALASSSSRANAGPGASGWNMTSSSFFAPRSDSTIPLDSTPPVVTHTSIFYYGSGAQTTSTSVVMYTTTLTGPGDSTVKPFSTSFSIPGTAPAAASPSEVAPLNTVPISATLTTSSPLNSSSSSLLGTGLSNSSVVASISAAAIPTTLSAGTAYSLPSIPFSPAVVSPSSVGSVSRSLPTALNTTSGPTVSASGIPASLGIPASPTNISTAVTLSSSPDSASTNGSLAASALTSTTAAIVVPLTTTLSSGSSAATITLETTSTTLALLGSSTPSTVSGYFVYNGTTILPSMPGTAAGGYSAPLTGSSLPSTISSVVSSISAADVSATSDGYPTVPIPETFSPRPSYLSSSPSAALSISVPVNASGPALSMISSVVSALTASSTNLIPSASSDLAGVLPTSNGLSPSSASLSLPGVYNSYSYSSPPSSLALSASSAAIENSATGSTSSAISSATTASDSVVSAQAMSSISSSSTNSTAATSASATATACGQHGPFTLSFDDLPNFTPSKQNQTDITQAPPVPNPYNHLTFSDGYVYAPSPREPYTPHSMPHLGIFLANGTGMSASTMKHGEIADGPYESLSAFWFDAYSAWLGCDNKGPDVCTLVFSGYTWSQAAGDETLAYTQNATIQPCVSFANCQLEEVAFPSSFRDLSGFQIQAFVKDEPRMFFVDDISLAWSNNTCAAGLMRQKYQ